MLQTEVMSVKKWFLCSVWIIFVATLSFVSVIPAYADEVNQGADSAQILQEFNKQHVEGERKQSITDKDKHRIMFLLGAVLIVFVLITGGLGIAMVVYGKPLFVPHMIFAGLSITLAIVHAIVGVVWFFPF